MSFTIDVATVQQFSANVTMLTEQKGSRLRSLIPVEDVTGDSRAFERLGSAGSPNLVTDRFGDTPINSLDHTRRWLYTRVYDYGEFVDNADEAKLLIDPKSRYTERFVSAMGRQFDDSILAALGGSVSEGHTGGTITPLPAAQQQASGSVGLTVNKLLEAKRRMDAAEVDSEDRYWVLSSTEVAQLLQDSRVTSSDFNTVQTLAMGQIDTYLGFKFIRSERLPVNGSAERLNYAFHRSAAVLGISKDINTKASERPDKRYAWQVYVWAQFGVIRLEDVRVVETACV